MYLPGPQLTAWHLEDSEQNPLTTALHVPSGRPWRLILCQSVSSQAAWEPSKACQRSPESSANTRDGCLVAASQDSLYGPSPQSPAEKVGAPPRLEGKLPLLPKWVPPQAAEAPMRCRGISPKVRKRGDKEVNRQTAVM